MYAARSLTDGRILPAAARRTVNEERDKLRGHAYNLGWRRVAAATAHTPTYSPPQPAAPSPTTATISIGRSEWQFIGQVCADRLRGSFRYDVELDSFWQFTEGTHWRLITDKKRLTGLLTDQRLSIAADLKDQCRPASDALWSANAWHQAIRSPLSEWWTEVRKGLLRPSPAPPDWQRATPGGVIDLRSGDIENHDPLVHDTLTVTRGEYRPDNANDLKDELFEKRLKHNITEEGYDSLLKLLGLAAARKAQELRAILWLHGKSGGGKGMVKNLLMASFHRCCGAVSLDMLERLSDDINAGLADLLEADPFLVLCDELGGPGIRERRLLSWTGNHPLSARRPHQTVPFTKTLRALWVCPTVDPPRLNSKDGFERRSAVIGFDRQFKGPGANEDFQQYEMRCSGDVGSGRGSGGLQARLRGNSWGERETQAAPGGNRPAPGLARYHAGGAGVDSPIGHRRQVRQGTQRAATIGHYGGAKADQLRCVGIPPARPGATKGAAPEENQHSALR